MSAQVDETGRLLGTARRSWTREEYHRAAETGVFAPGERLELIGGEITQRRSPQGSRHAAGVRAADEAARRLFGQGYDVRTQLPLALDDANEPEPDVAVVRGSFRDYVETHPTTAVLVIEVSDTTLRLDRHAKASLYARAGIPEYWLVNLTDRVVEVHRDPALMAEQPFGHHYRSVTRHAGADPIIPLGAPAAAPVPVFDLLP